MQAVTGFQHSVPREIAAAYDIADAPIEQLTRGRINATFAVGEPASFVVQRVNPDYFAEPQAVMENLVRVLGHLEWGARLAGDTGPRWFPELAPTRTGKPFAVDDVGHVWRAFLYLPGDAAGPKVDKPQVLDAAAMFGRLVGALDDLGGPPLIDTVARFRDGSRIVGEFQSGFDTSSPDRRDAVAPMMERLDALGIADQAGVVNRAVHNDTKLSNVLLAPGTGTPTAVIDYDLIMQGDAADDFGDFVRSASQGMDEAFDAATIGAIAGAFVDAAGGVLTVAEIERFATAPARICAQLAYRYLTDVVIDRPLLRVDPGENEAARISARVARAGRNLDLAEQFLGNRAGIEAVIAGVAQRCGADV